MDPVCSCYYWGCMCCTRAGRCMARSRPERFVSIPSSNRIATKQKIQHHAPPTCLKATIVMPLVEHLLLMPVKLHRRILVKGPAVLVDNHRSRPTRQLVPIKAARKTAKSPTTTKTATMAISKWEMADYRNVVLPKKRALEVPRNLPAERRTHHDQ